MNDFNYNFCVYDPRHPDYEALRDSLAIMGDDENMPEPGVDCSCGSCFYGKHKLACRIVELEKWVRMHSRCPKCHGFLNGFNECLSGCGYKDHWRDVDGQV